jgi:hypothetical protein
MFYATLEGTISSVNCEPHANTDVSGIGVRCALYLQAAFSIVLAWGKSAPHDVFAANVGLQAVSISLIAAAFFDPQIDVPHTIIVSHFAVLMSACRYSSNDFPAAFIQGPNGAKTAFGVWVIDILSRPILLLFNCYLWIVIQSLQQNNQLCPQGAGKWVFFGTGHEINVASFASKVAFVVSILDILWDAIRVVCEIYRLWVLRQAGPRGSREIGFDSRIWCVYKFWNSAHWNWPLACNSLVKISRICKISTCAYVVWAVETTIGVNDVSREEGKWTFGQIFAMANMLALFVLLCIRYRRFILRSSLGRSL